jgi:hypothetical protein
MHVGLFPMVKDSKLELTSIVQYEISQLVREGQGNPGHFFLTHCHIHKSQSVCVGGGCVCVLLGTQKGLFT